MADTALTMCNICLSTNKDDHIRDSSCFAKFFIKFLALKDFNEELRLCMWCRASTKRAIDLCKLAIETENVRQDEITEEILNVSRSLYTLNFYHNPHIDIPPVGIKECQDQQTSIHSDNASDNITQESKQLTNCIHETTPENRNEVEIQIKTNKNLLKCNEMKLLEMFVEESNEIPNFENDSLLANEVETKNRNKKHLDFNELKFEVEYLNLEEQLKEVEIKKVKYRDFKFQCTYCGVGYLTSDVFEEHEKRHLELSGPHKCNVCALRFKSQDVLSQHTLAHKRKFKCLLCSAIFKRWSHCMAHRYKCGGVVEPTACGECFKIFSNEYSLKIHMKVHKSEKKYSCDQCERKFASKQRLTVHMRSHSGIKPFSCEHCGRSFTTSSNLRAHCAVHSESSQYYCVECHTYYKTAKSLRQHFNGSARHMNSKTDRYVCKDCSKQFPTKKTLSCHTIVSHGTEYRCSQCDKTFSNNSNLNKHIKCIHTAK